MTAKAEKAEADLVSARQALRAGQAYLAAAERKAELAQAIARAVSEPRAGTFRDALLAGLSAPKAAELGAAEKQVLIARLAVADLVEQEREAEGAS